MNPTERLLRTIRRGSLRGGDLVIRTTEDGIGPDSELSAGRIGIVADERTVICGAANGSYMCSLEELSGRGYLVFRPTDPWIANRAAEYAKAVAGFHARRATREDSPRRSDLPPCGRDLAVLVDAIADHEPAFTCDSYFAAAVYTHALRGLGHGSDFLDHSAHTCLCLTRLATAVNWSPAFAPARYLAPVVGPQQPEHSAGTRRRRRTPRQLLSSLTIPMIAVQILKRALPL